MNRDFYYCCSSHGFGAFTLHFLRLLQSSITDTLHKATAGEVARRGPAAHVFLRAHVDRLDLRVREAIDTLGSRGNP